MQTTNAECRGNRFVRQAATRKKPVQLLRASWLQWRFCQGHFEEENHSNLSQTRVHCTCGCIGLPSATSQRSNRRSKQQIGSKQRQRPIQKHAGRPSSDRKTAPHLSDPRYLLKCDALSCEKVVKTSQTPLWRNKELRPARAFSPSILLYGTLALFRTNFPRCHALLCFVTSSLASPMSNSLLRGCPSNNNIEKTFAEHVGQGLHALLTFFTYFNHLEWSRSSWSIREKTTVFNTRHLMFCERPWDRFIPARQRMKYSSPDANVADWSIS